MGSYQGEPGGLMQSEHQIPIGEAAQGVAAVAGRSQLPAVDVLMAGQALGRRPGELEIVVAGLAGGSAVGPVERVSVLGVIEGWIDVHRAPAVRAVAQRAGSFERPVRRLGRLLGAEVPGRQERDQQKPCRCHPSRSRSVETRLPGARRSMVL
jgi:hypothetical protein